MNTSAIWIILLGIWVFVLQSRVSHLEKVLQKLLNRGNENGVKEEPLLEVHEKEAEVAKSTKMETEQNTEEYVSAVAEFKVSLAEDHISEHQTNVSNEMKESKPPWLMNYFTQGNILVRIGGVILFFGFAFLVKYAAEHSIISMEMRLMGVAAVAIVLILLGWKLRKREGAYGQILQGLGIAILYLLIYASSKYYMLMSLEMAFVLMIAVVLLGSLLAVCENSLPLALFATAGGFLVPILTSSGEGSHVVLFSYYVLLNVGIFIIAWYRSWRVLNLLGFVFTFLISTAWGVLRYEVALFETTEPFLVAFFMMYLAISILFTLKHAFSSKNLVDATLTFGLPLVAFPLQLALVEPMPYGEAYSALGLGTLYGILYFLLAKKERTVLLAQAFLALSVVFYTLSIPYFFDADVSAALWALESTAMIWISLKQGSVYGRYFGEVLLLLALFVYPESVQSDGITFVEYLGYLIVIASAVTAAYLLDKEETALVVKERFFAKVLLVLSLLLWFASTPQQLMFVSGMTHNQALLVALSFAGFVTFGLGKWLQWEILLQSLHGFLFLGILFFMGAWVSNPIFFHPFEGYGALSLSLFFALHLFFLYVQGKRWHFATANHVVGLWFVALVSILELQYRTEMSGLGENMWRMVIAMVLLTFSLFLLLPKQYPRWLKPYTAAYKYVAAGGMLLFLMFWEVWMFSRVYQAVSFPLFNLLDLLQIAVLLLAVLWIEINKQALSGLIKSRLYTVLAVLGTLLSAVLFARAVHHIQVVDYTFTALWASLYFQSGLSIVWSVEAIVLMLLAKKFSNRMFWFSGFGLLSVVVLKLFFVELANSGAIERIISFLVVGSLLLLVGYFVPLPPKRGEKA